MDEEGVVVVLLDEKRWKCRKKEDAWEGVVVVVMMEDGMEIKVNVNGTVVGWICTNVPLVLPMIR